MDVSIKTRSRTCTNPTPDFGGDDCRGRPEDVELCNQDIPCCTYIVLCLVSSQTTFDKKQYILHTNVLFKLQQEIVAGRRGPSGHNAQRLVEVDQKRELELKQCKKWAQAFVQVKHL